MDTFPSHENEIWNFFNSAYREVWTLKSVYMIKTLDNYLMAVVINVITNTKAQTLPPLPLLLLTISKITAYHFFLIAILVTNSIATTSSTIVTFTYNTTTITVNWRSSEDVTNIVNTSTEDENVSKIMPVSPTNLKQWD